MFRYSTRGGSSYGNASPRTPCAAAQIVGKQAARFWLIHLSLPIAYRRLGRHILGEWGYRDEFPDVYQRLDTCLSAIAALQAKPADEPEADGAAFQAIRNGSANCVHAQAIKLTVAHAERELGQAAFDKHGEASGPPNLIQPIVGRRTRLQCIDREIGQLRAEKANGPWLGGDLIERLKRFLRASGSNTLLRSNGAERGKLLRSGDE